MRASTRQPPTGHKAADDPGPPPSQIAPGGTHGAHSQPRAPRDVRRRSKLDCHRGPRVPGLVAFRGGGECAAVACPRPHLFPPLQSLRPLCGSIFVKICSGPNVGSRWDFFCMAVDQKRPPGALGPHRLRMSSVAGRGPWARCRPRGGSTGRAGAGGEGWDTRPTGRQEDQLADRGGQLDGFGANWSVDRRHLIHALRPGQSQDAI